MNNSSTEVIHVDHAVQPIDVIAGLGSADRNLLAVSLALFDDSTLSRRVAESANELTAQVKRRFTDDEVKQTAKSVESRTIFWHDSELSDDELRLTLWMYLRDAFALEPRLTISTRGAESLGCELAAATIYSADPPSLLRTGKDYLERLGWRGKDQRKTTLTDVVVPVIDELMTTALKDGAGQMDPAAQEKLIADMRERLAGLSEADQQKLLDAVGAKEMSDAAVRKILLTGGGLSVFSAGVGIAGFSAYILAAQASAFIPLVSGPALVSTVSVLSNPVTVVAATAVTLWWVTASTRKNLRTAVAMRVVALLALQGLSSARGGVERVLASFAAMPNLRPPEELESRTFKSYRREWQSLAEIMQEWPDVDPAMREVMRRPLEGLDDESWRLRHLLFPGQSEAHITGAIAALTLGDLVYSVAAIDPMVLTAADFARAEDLADPLTFAAFAHYIETLSPTGAMGAVSNVKGYVAEQLVAAELVAQGHQVEFPATPNQAGWDCLVDGKQFQVKCQESAAGLSEHFSRYPDIPVIANAELANRVPEEWKDKVFFVEGYTNEFTAHMTESSLEAGANVLNPNVPLFALSVIAMRNLMDFHRGKVSGRQAVEQTFLDGSTRAGLAVAGGYAGTTIGLLMLGPAGALVLGSVVPLLSQAQASRVRSLMEDHVKTESYKQWEEKANTVIDALVVRLESALETKRTILRKKYRAVEAGDVGDFIRWRLFDDAMFLEECKVRLTQVNRKSLDEPVEQHALNVIRFAANSTVHPVTYQEPLDVLRKVIEERPPLTERVKDAANSAVERAKQFFESLHDRWQRSRKWLPVKEGAVDEILAQLRHDATFRPARPDDADALAELVNFAGEGLPLYLWAKMAGPGETAWDVGRKRAARDEGSFSYRNATIVENDSEPAGCLIGYEIADRPDSVSPDMPTMFVPLQELENLAPATWYINVLAVMPEHRDKGLGTKLLALADETGRTLGKRGMSVIVDDANRGARRLYERCGYRETARRTMVKEEWTNAGLNWVLLTRQF